MSWPPQNDRQVTAFRTRSPRPRCSRSQAAVAGKFNHARQDRWVFGDRDSGAFLPKFAWTKILRHTMVTDRSPPDDPH